MGIYSRKFAINESEGLDSVQTPDDIGVDLNQIEKDIEGEHGLEAHPEEIEDALTGVVEEPLEEAFRIMYEGEYNFSQIMQTIGMKELSEATMGRDYVLEAVDVKGFLKRAQEWLKEQFEKVMEVLQKLQTAIAVKLMNDKKFVEKNKEKIVKAYNSDWSLKGYKFTEVKNILPDMNQVSYFINNVKEGDGDTDTLADVIKRSTGIEVDSIKKLGDAIVLKGRGDETEKITLSNSNIDINKDVLDILLKNKDTEDIKTIKDKIKKEYVECFKEFKTMKKDGNYDDAWIFRCASVIKTYSSVINTAYIAVVRVHKDRIAQARTIAYRLAKSKEEKETTPKTESYTSTFNRIQFI